MYSDDYVAHHVVGGHKGKQQEIRWTELWLDYGMRFISSYLHWLSFRPTADAYSQTEFGREQPLEGYILFALQRSVQHRLGGDNSHRTNWRLNVQWAPQTVSSGSNFFCSITYLIKLNQRNICAAVSEAREKRCKNKPING